ncbi:hypothetical protein PVAP13_9KG518500 [Panicum virgatum]|uniref:BZIP domain-containing protein n=1 Tax=Panicum virgatum TaxID=38727 RepID=A0A8T0NUM7_PANVG|nr:hypothetical protein PVAP13_9KG518500 [Panicum virgatum]
MAILLSLMLIILCLKACYATGGQPYAWHAAQNVPYTAGEPVAAPEGKSKRKSSGAPSVGNASRSSDGRSEETSDKRYASVEHKLLPSAKRRMSTGANVQVPSCFGGLQQCKRRSAGKLLVSTTEMAAISNARPNLNIGLDLWSNSLVKQDDGELKSERRNQSNRESARRSRLRKQGEMEQAEEPSVVTTLSMHIEKAKVHHGKSDQHRCKKVGA